MTIGSVPISHIPIGIHLLTIVPLAGDGDGQGQWVDLEGTVVNCDLVDRIGRCLQYTAVGINRAGCIGCGIDFVQLMRIAALFPDEVVVLGQRSL